MADYVDAGGAVVLTQYTLGPYTPLEGRFQSEDYHAIEPGQNVQSSGTTLGTVYDADHPILNGVEYLDDCNICVRTSGEANTNTTVIADWADGNHLLAVREINGVRRADLGIIPVGSQGGHYGGWNAGALRTLEY